MYSGLPVHNNMAISEKSFSKLYHIFELSSRIHSLQSRPNSSSISVLQYWNIIFSCDTRCVMQVLAFSRASHSTKLLPIISRLSFAFKSFISLYADPWSTCREPITQYYVREVAVVQHLLYSVWLLSAGGALLFTFKPHTLSDSVSVKTMHCS